MRAAEAIAVKIHPQGEALSEINRKFHTRNVFQVLGPGLDRESDILVCSAPNLNGDMKKVTGGTSTAWDVAMEKNIPCFNVRYLEDEASLRKYIDEIKRERGMPVVIEAQEIKATVAAVKDATSAPFQPVSEGEREILLAAIRMGREGSLTLETYLDPSKLNGANVKNQWQFKAMVAAVLDKVKSAPTNKETRVADLTQADLSPINREIIRAALEMGAANPKTLLEYEKTRNNDEKIDELERIESTATRCVELSGKIASLPTRERDAKQRESGERTRTPNRPQ